MIRLETPCVSDPKSPVSPYQRLRIRLKIHHEVHMSRLPIGSIFRFEILEIVPAGILTNKFIGKIPEIFSQTYVHLGNFAFQYCDEV